MTRCITIARVTARPRPMRGWRSPRRASRVTVRRPRTRSTCPTRRERPYPSPALPAQIPSDTDDYHERHQRPSQHVSATNPALPHHHRLIHAAAPTARCALLLSYKCECMDSRAHESEYILRILQVKKIPFTSYDLASDDDAKKLWRRKAPKGASIVTHLVPSQ